MHTTRIRYRAVAVALFLSAIAVAPSFASAPAPQTQDARSRHVELPEEEIIRRFTTAESQLRDARNQYTFKQDVTIQTLMLGSSDIVTGTYRRVSEILFDDRSQRIEKITYFPQPTLKEMSVSPEDLRDLGIVQPFALTAEDLPRYIVRKVGKEKLDELNTYVFDVAPRDPKSFEKSGDRYFIGRVWVDDEDYMIVKVAGQAGPQVKNQRFPRFETYRENIDGKYWFPTYTYADDVLDFDTQNVHMRMVVHYADYKQFTGSITIEEGSEEQVPPSSTEPTTTPAPPPQTKKP